MNQIIGTSDILLMASPSLLFVVGMGFLFMLVRRADR